MKDNVTVCVWGGTCKWEDLCVLVDPEWDTQTTHVDVGLLAGSTDAFWDHEQGTTAPRTSWTRKKSDDGRGRGEWTLLPVGGEGESVWEGMNEK